MDEFCIIIASSNFDVGFSKSYESGSICLSIYSIERCQILLRTFRQTTFFNKCIKFKNTALAILLCVELREWGKKEILNYIAQIVKLSLKNLRQISLLILKGNYEALPYIDGKGRFFCSCSRCSQNGLLLKSRKSTVIFPSLLQ